MITDTPSFVKLVYTGVGEYSYSMVCMDEAHLSVKHIGENGVVVVLNPSQYSVVLGVGNVGGTVTVTDALLGSQGMLSIERSLPLAQSVDFTNAGRLDMELLERSFDLTVMLIQQIADFASTSTFDMPWRGTWQTDTLYGAKDLVIAPDGDWYTCIEGHEASVFSTDLSASKWLLWIPMASYMASILNAIKTAEDLLASIKTVDGAGCGLDADLLDGKHASEFATATQGATAETAYTRANSAYTRADEAYALASAPSGFGNASKTCVIGAASAGPIREVALNPALRITGGGLTPSHSISLFFPGSFILFNPSAGHDPANDYGGTWEKRSVTWGSYTPSCDLWFRIA